MVVNNTGTLERMRGRMPLVWVGEHLAHLRRVLPLLEEVVPAVALPAAHLAVAAHPEDPSQLVVRVARLELLVDLLRLVVHP